MSRTTLGMAILVLALGAVQPTRGDYATGQRAWDASRPHEARAQWREAAEAGDPREFAETRRNVIGFRVAQTLR